MIVERLAHPRLRIYISIKDLPEIIKISLQEDCSAADIARVIRKINHLLLFYGIGL